MEAIINIVEIKCNEQMDSYAHCVNQNPETWLEKCSKERQQLNECSSQHPVIKTVNKRCSKEFRTYDDCLRQNSSEPQRCSAELELFSLCAEEAAALYDASEGKP